MACALEEVVKGMSSLEEIKIDLQGIGHQVKDNTLSVPKYQRSYAWKEQHVRDLLQDLTTAITGGESEYFLGTIVATTAEGGGFEVIDGQQRLATTTILLAAIRDYFHRSGDMNRASDIEQTYLVTRDLRSQEKTPKLRLNDTDHDFFAKKVLSNPDDPQRKVEPQAESHRRIAKAAELAEKHVRSLVDVQRLPTEHLLDWVEFVEAKARIIWVRVPDDTNAFTIFETLNDRGLALTISDLLKNFLFGRAENRLAEVQQRWVSMFGLLEAQDDEEVVVAYIRHYWSSKYGLTRERQLYAEIKKLITSKQAAVDFANELAEEARVYAALLNPNHELWVKYGGTARGHVATLNLLGMIQIRPLLLSVIKRFRPKEVSVILRLLVVWAVRFTIYGGLGSGPLESHYSEKAKQVRDRTIKTPSALLNRMKSIIPTDSEFKDAFARATISKTHLGRYYLSALERQMRGETNPELVPNPNEEEVNLEHILPQSPSPGWNYIDEDTRKTHCKRLGNMCLLRVTANIEAGGESFKIKRAHYRSSEFQLTKAVARYENWGPEQIEQRQAELGDVATKTWPNKL